jgi:hypothetical protein
VFVAAFVRSHGSIKEMEQVFGVSYPTVKARLNRIAADAGDGRDVEPTARPRSTAASLERLKRGEISADQAVAELEGRLMTNPPVIVSPRRHARPPPAGARRERPPRRERRRSAARGRAR